MKLLLAFSGSVASIKAEPLLSRLLSAGVEVRVLLTEPACHFVGAQVLDGSPDKPNPLGALVYRDRDEWQAWSAIGDPVLHIEVCRF